MTRPLLLDLFCGAGGAAMGYYQAGFDVVGVDIKPQPHCPLKFMEMDALTFLVFEFPMSELEYAVIHASPPCQPSYTQFIGEQLIRVLEGVA